MLILLYIGDGGFMHQAEVKYKIFSYNIKNVFDICFNNSVRVKLIVELCKIVFFLHPLDFMGLSGQYSTLLGKLPARCRHH